MSKIARTIGIGAFDLTEVFIEEREIATIHAGEFTIEVTRGAEGVRLCTNGLEAQSFEDVHGPRPKEQE